MRARLGLFSAVLMVGLMVGGCGGTATASGVSSNTSATVPGGESQPLVFPMVFRGTGDVLTDAHTEFGSQASVSGESTADIEIVLEVDGSARGTLTFHQSINYFCTEDDRHGDVELRDKEVVNDLEGTHDLSGGFVLDSPYGDLIGTYDFNTLTGRQSFVSVHEPDEECGVTHYLRELTITGIPGDA